MANSKQSLEPSRSEIEMWLRHPVSTWFFQAVGETVGDPDAGWRGAGSWEAVCRLQGQARVLSIIRELVNHA